MPVIAPQLDMKESRAQVENKIYFNLGVAKFSAINSTRRKDGFNM